MLHYIGNYAKSRFNAPYPRNIWELKAYRGRLYLGCGNSSNEQPSPNAGPVDIVCYDPASQDFVVEASQIPEEQIERFVILDDRLLLPGHDPTRNDNLRIYLREADGSWTFIPCGEGQRQYHLYDLTPYQGWLYLAKGINFLQSDAAARIRLSDFWAEQYRFTELPVPSRSRLCTMCRPAWRLYHFFEVGGQLYAIGELSNLNTYSGAGPGGAYVYSPWSNAWNQLDNLFFLGVNPKLATIRFSANLNDRLVYIVSKKHNDHHHWPQQMAWTDGQSVTPIPCPEGCEAGFLPWDVTVVDGAAYGLFSKPIGDQFEVQVRTSRDLTNWAVTFTTQLPSFARAFAYLDGDWYLGLGCEWIDGQWYGNPDAAGMIYRWSV
ncbi:hypothetical protein GS597_14425 [Synechococcales cyanobacterium C]|uniref:Uncharacterized protein n=1 Tax=Petrachloros mirabilis ULC683 TaxID=2781853 RepID=A0A8K2A866_9CYAN|nr:hypothetical protein [Petrachloros mirabilis]NCJ07684.1 hypothetical protein [Petrachloros mirabilis ULC683]